MKLKLGTPSEIYEGNNVTDILISNSFRVQYKDQLSSSYFSWVGLFAFRRTGPLQLRQRTKTRATTAKRFVLFPLKLSEKFRFSDDFRTNRS